MTLPSTNHLGRAARVTAIAVALSLAEIAAGLVRAAGLQNTEFAMSAVVSLLAHLAVTATVATIATIVGRRLGRELALPALAMVAAAVFIHLILGGDVPIAVLRPQLLLIAIVGGLAGVGVVALVERAAQRLGVVAALTLWIVAVFVGRLWSIVETPSIVDVATSVRDDAIVSSPQSRPDVGRPDVVLLVIDTLRADALDDPARTPHIAALAAAGVTFTQARTPAPFTLAAMTSVFAGLRPSALALDDDFRTFAIPPDRSTLAEQLQAAGYRTGAVIGNTVLGAASGCHRGFDSVALAGDYARRPLAIALPHWGRILTAIGTALDVARKSPDHTSFVVRHARQFLREHDDRPYFLWAHLLDPHEPLEPPRHLRPARPCPPRLFDREIAALGASVDGLDCVRRLYASEVSYVDEAVGQLMALVNERGRDTIVVLLSDHGEELGEHGAFGHGRTLYDEQLRVPLIISAGALSRGVTVDAPVSTLDTFATLHALLDLTEPETIPGAGRSLLTVVRGEELPVVAPHFAGETFGERQLSVTSPRHKLILRPATGAETAFDLVADPEELHPLSEEAPWRAALRSELARYVSEDTRVREQLGTHDGGASEELLERLRGLGYVP